jgi:RNA polymerase sigma-70 factor (ECF subfamily)
VAIAGETAFASLTERHRRELHLHCYRMRDWRLVPTMANRMPTAASYLRAPGDTAFRAFKLDVLRVANGKIAEITTFGRVLFPQFGLPQVLPD